MRRPMCGISVLAILLGMLFSLAGTRQAAAQVQVNVNIGPPPRYVIPAPPPVIVIPGTYVYAVPDIEVDILFYQGYWYRPHQGYWFRSRSYNGPWVYLAAPQVPRVLIELPPDYRRPPPGYRRIPYGQFKKNRVAWDRQRYWERDREWREGWHRGPEGRGGDVREGHHEKPEHGKPEGHGGHEGHGGGHEGK
jgi:hypothetical protein